MEISIKVWDARIQRLPTVRVVVQADRQPGMTYHNKIQLHCPMPYFTSHLQCAGSDKNFLSLANITAVSTPLTGSEGGPALHAVACTERLLLRLQCARDCKKGRESTFLFLLSLHRMV